jgi:4-hydroxy-tetrahydrodipicolinate reductase
MNERVTHPSIRVLVHGGTGRMGQALLRLAADRRDLDVVGAVSRKVGQRVVEGIPRYGADELQGVPAFDVAVDFSLAAGFDPILDACVQRNAALVSGTTGLDDAQRAAIAVAARRIPILWASNFSLGVAVLHDLVARAARALPGGDCDIVESHHAGQRGAPSGTALSLGDAIQSHGGRPRYASLRAGDIVGEHLVQFTGQGERLELLHRASNRDVFAHGALHAATRLVGREPGIFVLSDLID